MLAVAVVASLIGAVVWRNVVADDGRAVDDEVTLVEPGEYVEPGTATNPPIDRQALPEVALRDAAGVVFDPAVDDRPMVLNVWVSTCPPCARELVEFTELDRELGDPVRFVGVNPSDDAERMTEFAAARDVDYELFLDDDGAFTDELGIVAFPVTLLVAPDGTIVDEMGAVTGRELRQHLVDRWGVA